ADLAAEAVEHAEHELGIHAVRVEEKTVLLALDALRIGEIRLEHEHGARRLAAACGVDEDQRVKTLEQLIREVDAADTEGGDGDVLGNRLAGQLLPALDADAIVSEEDVADAGNEAFSHSAPPAGIGSISSGAK